MSHTRRLRAGQRDDLARHLLRLDPESRRLRFMGDVSDARLVEYVRLLPALASLQIGWFDDEGAMRGCGELHVRPGALFDHRAELALSVETAWRGRGIGRHLLEHLMVVASNRGIHVLLVQCLEENRAMRQLVRGRGGRSHINDGEVRALLFPVWRSQVTLACEWLAEACAALNWWHPRFMAHCGQARGKSRGPVLQDAKERRACEAASAGSDTGHQARCTGPFQLQLTGRRTEKDQRCSPPPSRPACRRPTAPGTSTTPWRRCGWKQGVTRSFASSPRRCPSTTGTWRW